MKQAWAHVRGNAVAYVALFFALGGTGAWAAATIGSSDIEKKAVLSKHIAPGQVKPNDSELTKFSSAADEVPYTTMTALPGPALAVKAKAGDLILHHATATLRRTLGDGQCTVNVVVQGPGFFSASGAFSTTSASNDTLFLNHGQSGTFNRGQAIARSVPVTQDGTYEFSLQASPEPGTECVVVDRAIWVSVLR